MRRFTYSCAACGSSYEELRDGTDAPPRSIGCRCGKRADRVWVAPQVCVVDSEIEYKPKDFLPHYQRLDAHGRNAKQVQRETDRILQSKRRQAQRAKRAGIPGKSGMRHIGSIDAKEVAAFNKRAGSKNAFFENPREVLKRTGNLF